jgi:hypothetical protein
VVLPSTEEEAAVIEELDLEDEEEEIAHLETLHRMQTQRHLQIRNSLFIEQNKLRVEEMAGDSDETPEPDDESEPESAPSSTEGEDEDDYDEDEDEDAVPAPDLSKHTTLNAKFVHLYKEAVSLMGSRKNSFSQAYRHVGNRLQRERSLPVQADAEFVSLVVGAPTPAARPVAKALWRWIQTLHFIKEQLDTMGK